jgi:hypothetical protein
MRVGGQRHTPAALPPGKGAGTHAERAGWISGPIWTGTENLAQLKERVQLYVYSPPWAFMACSRMNFTFILLRIKTTGTMELLPYYTEHNNI